MKPVSIETNKSLAEAGLRVTQNQRQKIARHQHES